MFAKPTTAAVPSRGALRILRQLALASSTIGAIGSVCTVATLTYDVHRRVHLAERVIENKRNLQVSCPNYDAMEGAEAIAKMMEAAEAGEFMGLDSMRNKKKRRKQKTGLETQPELEKGEIEKQVDRDKGGSEPINPTSSPSREHASPIQQDPYPRLWRNNHELNKHQNRLPEHTPSALPRGVAAEYQAINQSNLIQSEFKTHYSSSKPIITPLAQIRQYLHQDKAIEAAELFLQSHPTSIVGGISTERRYMAVRLFFMNLEQGNVFLARTVFERIHALDEVTSDMWEALLSALGKRGRIESVAELYMAYGERFRLPQTLLSLVLRSLIDSHRLWPAKRLIHRNLIHDSEGGLSGIYLSGLWKKTRDINLLVTQYEHLLSKKTAAGQKPTEKLINPLLQAYIDVGKEEDAQVLAEQMETRYNAPLSARTRGLFVFAKALRCDWDGVELGLRKMHDIGLSKKHPNNFAKVFDRIFLEFWLSHSGPAICDFVFRAINNYGLVPDMVLFNHIIEAFVEKGDSDMVAELMETVKKRDWNLSLNKEKFMMMIRRRRLACQVSPVGLWQMFRTTQQKFGNAATSQRILGYDPYSYPDDEAYLIPWSRQPESRWQKTTSGSPPRRAMSNYLALRKRMIHQIQTGKWAEAVNRYVSAKQAGKVMKQIHIELAVTASIVGTGSTDEAKTIMKENNDTICGFADPVIPMFFQQVRLADDIDETAAIKLVLFNFYELLEKHLFPCKHHITVAASAQLIHQGKYDAAIDLLTSVYKSRFGLAVKFDAVTMKMLIRAFGCVRNLDGVRWGIYTALKRPSALNRDFKVEVRRVIASLRSQPVLQRNQTKYEYDSALDKLSDQAALLTNAIGQRSDNLVQERNHGAEAESMDPVNKKILENWDEGQELEKALHCYESLPTGDVEDWSEDQVWAERIDQPINEP